MFIPGDLPSPRDLPTLQVELRTDPGGYTIRLVGELDCSSAGQLLESVGSITVDGRREVVLDVADLTFCDAAGLSAILRVDRFVAAASGHLSVRDASRQMRRLLALTGLDRSLDLE